MTTYQFIGVGLLAVAGLLALFKREGWGWFLFMGLLFL